MTGERQRRQLLHKHRVPWPKDRPELSLHKNMEFLSGPAAGEGKHESLVCVIQASITHWWEQAPTEQSSLGSGTSPGLLSHGTEQWKNSATGKADPMAVV